MDQPDLFPLPQARILTADELTHALAAAIAPGTRASREADVYLATVCARDVAVRLMSSGLRVIGNDD